MKSILLIDSEAGVSFAVRQTLIKFGFYVESATSNREVHDRVTNEEFDLILLEFNLQPEVEEDPRLPASALGRGLGLIRELRACGVTTPIVVYSVLEGDAYETSALDAGADDYLVKRVAISTLLCRLNAHLRRRELDLGTRSRADRRAQVGHLILDRRTRALIGGETTVALTDAEVRLVGKLASNPSRIVSTHELLTEIWGDSKRRNTGRLSATIKSLLRKTRKLGLEEMIEATADEGYLLAPSIRFPRS